jgi:3-dehydroquinate synthetase
MRDSTIARNYAETLLVLATRAEDLRGWGKMLSDVATAMRENPTLRLFLESPKVSAAQKSEVIGKAFTDRMPRLMLRFLQTLVHHRRQMLIPTIAESCQIKANVVTEDERETGRRRILNFGHTAGHALEAVTKYRRFRHGEAVAYGMLVAAELATARGTLSPGDRDTLRALIAAMGPLPAVADLDVAQVVGAVGRDKKVIDGRLHYVLPVSIGETIIADDVTGVELEQALRAIGLRGST